MEELVKKLKADGVLKTPSIIKAFLENDRLNFVLPDFKKMAYEDAPLPTKKEQTISQPYTVAFMLELLEPEAGQRILDIGFGSGWTTALLSSLVGPKGRVYAIEVLPEVYEFGSDNLARLHRKNIELRLGSGWDGWPEHEPFDRILVSAAAQETPLKLTKQLRIGGRMVIPVGQAEYKGECPIKTSAFWKDAFSFGQSVKLIERKSENEYQEKDHPGFAFVPLVR